MRKLLLSLYILILSHSAYAASATVISESPLHQNPSIQSSVLTTLKVGTKVDTIKRNGGWKLITTNDSQSKTGWLRSYKVRQGAISIVKKEEGSGGFFSGLASLSRKASGLFSSEKKDYSFSTTATIGVRGLSEEEIKNAQPDLKQLKQLDRFKSSKKSTLAFAKQGLLKSTSLKHLKKSKAEK